MPYRVELSRRAERDLHRIFSFIHGSESQAAARWFNGLEEPIDGLATLPNSGTATDYDPNLLFFLYGNKPHVYRILYRVDEANRSVTVQHIRHGARKPLGPAS
jgi:plasmid stabilization system protein ParE